MYICRAALSAHKLLPQRVRNWHDEAWDYYRGVKVVDGRQVVVPKKTPHGLPHSWKTMPCFWWVYGWWLRDSGFLWCTAKANKRDDHIIWQVAQQVQLPTDAVARRIRIRQGPTKSRNGETRNVRTNLIPINLLSVHWTAPYNFALLSEIGLLYIDCVGGIGATGK